MEQEIKKGFFCSICLATDKVYYRLKIPKLIVANKLPSTDKYIEEIIEDKTYGMEYKIPYKKVVTCNDGSLMEYSKALLILKPEYVKRKVTEVIDYDRITELHEEVYKKLK